MKHEKKSKKLGFLNPLKKLSRKPTRDFEKKRADIWEQDTTFEDSEKFLNDKYVYTNLDFINQESPHTISSKCICCNKLVSYKKSQPYFKCPKCETTNISSLGNTSSNPESDGRKGLSLLYCLYILRGLNLDNFKEQVIQYKSTNDLSAIKEIIISTFSSSSILNESFIPDKASRGKDSGIDWAKLSEFYTIALSLPPEIPRLLISSSLKALINPQTLFKRRGDIRFLLIIFENPLLKYVSSDRYVFQILKHIFGLISNFSETLQNFFILLLSEIDFSSLQKKVFLVSKFISISLDRYIPQEKSTSNKQNRLSSKLKNPVDTTPRDLEIIYPYSDAETSKPSASNKNIDSVNFADINKLNEHPVKLTPSNDPKPIVFAAFDKFPDLIHDNNPSKNISYSTSNYNPSAANIRNRTNTLPSFSSNNMNLPISDISYKPVFPKHSLQLKKYSTDPKSLKTSKSDSRKSNQNSEMRNKYSLKEKYPFQNKPKFDEFNFDVAFKNAKVNYESIDKNDIAASSSKNQDVSQPSNILQISIPDQKSGSSVKNANRIISPSESFNLSASSFSSQNNPLSANRNRFIGSDINSNRTVDDSYSPTKDIMITQNIVPEDPIKRLESPGNQASNIKIPTQSNDVKTTSDIPYLYKDIDIDISPIASRRAITPENRDLKIRSPQQADQRIVPVSSDRHKNLFHDFIEVDMPDINNKLSNQNVLNPSEVIKEQHVFELVPLNELKLDSPITSSPKPKKVSFTPTKPKNNSIYSNSNSFSSDDFEVPDSKKVHKFKSLHYASDSGKSKIHSKLFNKFKREQNRATDSRRAISTSVESSNVNSLAASNKFSRPRNRTTAAGIELSDFVFGDDGIIYPNSSNKLNYGNNWSLHSACKVMKMIYISSKLRSPRQTRLEPSKFVIKNLDKMNLNRDYMESVKDVKKNKPNNVGFFAFCNYPFLLSLESKVKILQTDSTRQMNMKVKDAFLEAILNKPQTSLEDELNRSIPETSSILQYDIGGRYDNFGMISEIRLAPPPPRVEPIASSSHNSPDTAATQNTETNRFKNLCLNLNIRRNCLTEDSLFQISSSHSDLKKPLKIQFVGEDGVDAGGLTKEFFMLIVRELTDPMHGMYTFDPESKTRAMWFNPASFETSDHYFLSGVIVGLAIYNGIVLDLKFPAAIYKKLMNINVYDLPVILSKSPLGPLPTKAPRSLDNQIASFDAEANSMLSISAQAKLQLNEMLEDLSEINPGLVRGFKSLLSYTEDDLESVFCLVFEASYDSYAGQ
ncbi:putative E3 ubiquitin-protein ligase HERC4 [Smittium culicis]|uniref:Putative E3 ubiquitin-protein ligase HERC4 n=1 Tax=Smittium culicis TaxID=133412 RepID=A0A1R1Y4C5_9FUNG|nr:putative E3 ubiquitin-protein ligase HERC4 [Smittium culicis]